MLKNRYSICIYADEISSLFLCKTYPYTELSFFTPPCISPHSAVSVSINLDIPLPCLTLSHVNALQLWHTWARVPNVSISRYRYVNYGSEIEFNRKFPPPIPPHLYSTKEELQQWFMRLAKEWSLKRRCRICWRPEGGTKCTSCRHQKNVYVAESYMKRK